ncbi:hypothetical protein B566_EDAN018071, partial [Ephemera danica]
MVHCCIKNCSSNTRDKIRSEKVGMFCIPAIITNQDKRTEELTRERQSLWLARINRKDFGASWRGTTSTNLPRVCGKHFVSGRSAKLVDYTNVDWAPTLNLGYSSRQAPLNVSVGRNTMDITLTVDNNSTQKSDLDGGTHNLLNYSMFDHDYVQGVTLLTPPRADAACQTELGSTRDVECQTDFNFFEFMEYHTKVVKDNQNLRGELKDVKGEMINLEEVNTERLKTDVKYLNFFTGLPNYSIFMIIFNLCEQFIASNHRNSVSKVTEFFMVLMKLRLNPSFTDLGYRFNISETTASRIFKRWIHVMSVRLSPFIKWPSRENLRDTMPLSFRAKFGTKVAIIIDCFEIFIENPTSLFARAVTWSSYKNHTTAKYLIGVTPQGTVAFISEGWGGRVSDKHLTERSGLIENLLPGDLVMADRGFLISDLLSTYDVDLAIPVFMRGKDQLSLAEADISRKISNLRINVERVIGLVRNKYSILRATVPVRIEMITSDDNTPTLLDKIVKVCCSLGWCLTFHAK